MSFGLQEYLASKEQLTQAVKKQPNIVVEYEVVKYTKLPTGTSKDLCEYVNLKPKDVVSIEWLFDTQGDTATVVSFTIEGTRYHNFNGCDRVMKWLHTNTKLDDTNWFI